MAMALIYYLGANDRGEILKESSYILGQQNNKFYKLFCNQQEVIYWISKALVNLENYVGECTRVIQIDD